jgi:hypothetical protein
MRFVNRQKEGYRSGKIRAIEKSVTLLVCWYEIIAGIEFFARPRHLDYPKALFQNRIQIQGPRHRKCD